MRCYSCKAITSSQWQSHKIKHQQWGAACGNNWKSCFSCSKVPQGVGIFGRSQYISTAESKLNSRKPFLSPSTYLFLRMGGSSKRGRNWEIFVVGSVLTAFLRLGHLRMRWFSTILFVLSFYFTMSANLDRFRKQRREREKKVSKTSSFLLLES